MRAAVIALALCGCMSHYSGGPQFREVAPREGLAVVYAYRPARSWGAATMIVADVYGRTVNLCSNSFAAFVVPAGPLTANMRIDANVMMSVVDGFGVTGVVTTGKSIDKDKGLTPVPIQVEAGKSYFVRVQFDAIGKAPAAKLVTAERGRDDIASLHLIPGGRARWPVVLPPDEPAQE